MTNQQVLDYLLSLDENDRLLPFQLVEIDFESTTRVPRDVDRTLKSDR